MMMKNRSHITRTISLSALAGVVLLIALGAGRVREAAPSPAAAGRYVLPATQIISFDDTIGRLDTATGAVYRLRGNLDNPSVRHTWALRVPPVDGPTSGLLEIQQATFNEPGATFLVDIVTGRTWILQRRAGENGTWDPVEIFQ
jgi:hypothetical protein